MVFEYFNESDSSGDIPDPEPVKTAIETVLNGENRVAGVITVVLLPNDALRAMKSEHFGIDAFTDIIAFNLNDPDENEIEGEIYLSPTQIRQNASDFNTTFQQEFLRVIIHGSLHLCGYEDSTAAEKNHMRALEDKYLAKLEVL